MIKIISVGAIKNKNLEYLINDYLTKLKKYHPIYLLEVKDEDEKNDKSIKIESERVKRILKEKDYVILLSLDGKEYNSLSFAKEIEKSISSYKSVVFVIGGSNGIDEKIIKPNLKISFSHLTFPHQLFRLILLEQIYRAFKINNNERYHK